jgi:hypothetical protein
MAAPALTSRAALVAKATLVVLVPALAGGKAL